MPQYLAKIRRHGATKPEIIRTEADTIDAAIAAFWGACNRYDSLLEVRGGHEAGELRMPKYRAVHRVKE